MWWVTWMLNNRDHGMASASDLQVLVKAVADGRSCDDE